MKKYKLCGIGNSIVDIFVPISEADFARLQFEKGTMRLVDADEQAKLLGALKEDGPAMAAGGSVANSIISFSQLGGSSSFIGVLGDDKYGRHYKEEFESLGIAIGDPIVRGGTTGTSVVMVTPDAERTMRTALAISGTLSAPHVDEEKIKNSEWLFVEGYLFANPDYGQTAVRQALKYAAAHKTKVAITCSEAFVVEVFGGALNEALKEASLVFTNETEAQALSGESDPKRAFDTLKSRFPTLVVTAGAKGAYIKHDGSDFWVEAFPCTPKDLTGAGDMFAGAFLYGITHGIPVRDTGRAACFLASKVISHVGARLPKGTKEFWNDALKR